jgi:hypothetical protein
METVILEVADNVLSSIYFVIRADSKNNANSVALLYLYSSLIHSRVTGSMSPTVVITMGYAFTDWSKLLLAALLVLRTISSFAMHHFILDVCKHEYRSVSRSPSVRIRPSSLVSLHSSLQSMMCLAAESTRDPVAEPKLGKFPNDIGV